MTRIKARQIQGIDTLSYYIPTSGNTSGNSANAIYSTTISASTYYNLPTDLFTTGGTYNNSTGTATFGNSIGGTYSVNGFYTGYTAPNYGFTTGGTYNNSTGTATFGNSTGGTYSVSGFYTGFTGGTVTGATNFTNGLTSNTISATTYFGLPTDIYTTGGTYNSIAGTITFGNSTGGTFVVTGVTSGSGTFTGGTVVGATNFTNGLTSNTISATSISANTLAVISTPVNNDSNAQILSRNPTTGAIEYTNSSVFSGGSSSSSFNYGLANAMINGNFLP